MVGKPIEFAWRGRAIVVQRNTTEQHPPGYTWITVDGRQFFLTSDPRARTRRQVRELAERWLLEREER